MQIAITQIPLLTQKQIPEKTFQIDRSIVNPLHDISIIGPHQGVTEIPRMICKHIIVYPEAQIPQIKDCKDSRCACISLTKRMNLPDSGNKLSDMGHQIIGGYPLVTKITFLSYVVVQSPMQIFPIQVKDSIIVKHPFLFCYIIIPQFAGMFEHSVKYSAMQGNNAL